MSNILNKMSKYVILQSILSVLLGLFLLIWPQTTLMTVVYLLGAYLCIMAALDLISYFRHKNDIDYVNSDLISGVFQLIVGVLVLLFPKVVVSLLPVLLGVVVILGSVMNMARSFEVKKFGEGSWLLVLIVSIITTILGVIIIVNPFSSIVTFIRICGIMLLLKGIIDVFTYFLFRKSASKKEG